MPATARSYKRAPTRAENHRYSRYRMPPHEGFTIAHFLTVSDIDRSVEFYAMVFDGEVVFSR